MAILLVPRELLGYLIQTQMKDTEEPKLKTGSHFKGLIFDLGKPHITLPQIFINGH